MRVFAETCLRNLQDRMLVFGFEGWDIFIVLGVALVLQMVNVNNYVLWLVVGATSGFLLVIKRGKPAKATEHYIDWFIKDKKYTAIPQAISQSIRGRSFDIKLNALQEILPYSHFEDGFLVLNDDSFSAGYEIGCPSVESMSSDDLIAYTLWAATGKGPILAKVVLRGKFFKMASLDSC